jgi:hypothetical protein
MAANRRWWTPVLLRPASPCSRTQLQLFRMQVERWNPERDGPRSEPKVPGQQKVVTLDAGKAG